MRRRRGLLGKALGAAMSLALLQGSIIAWADEERPFTVLLQAGRLSLAARDAPLGAILAEVGHQGSLEIRLDIPLERRVSREVVTVAFEAEAVEAALHRLLGAEHLVFLYSRAGLVEVRAYAGRPGAASSDEMAGGGSGAGEVGRAELARLQREALEDPDPTVRGRAFDEMARSGDATLARETALEVLQRDGDEDMLARALALLSDVDGVPLGPIIRFATNHRGSQLRVRALELLTERARDDVRVSGLLLTLSRRDPDASVRASASALLRGLSQQ